MSLSVAWLLPDPEHSTPTRMLLVAAYVVAGCLWLGRRARSSAGPGTERTWWTLGAVLLFLLAANKLFDLREQCELALRALARAGHWYDQRQSMQFVMAIVLPALAAAAAGFVAWNARVFICRRPLILAGWILLLLYLALRQSQEWKPMLPWLDTLRYHDWRLALEASGLLLVSLGSLTAGARPTCSGGHRS